MPFRPNNIAKLTENKNGKQLQSNNDVSDSGQSFMSSSSSDANSIDSLEEHSAVQNSARHIVDQGLNESLKQSNQEPIEATSESKSETANNSDANLGQKDNAITQENNKDMQEQVQPNAVKGKEGAMEQTEVKTTKPATSVLDKQMEIKSLLTNHQTSASKQQQLQLDEHKQSDLEPDSLSSVDNSILSNNNNNHTAGKPMNKPSLKQVNNNNIDEDQFGGLNLNMTASEMRELLSRRKKFDPKKAQMNIRQKYEIIQQM